jgi:hypothetical protein
MCFHIDLYLPGQGLIVMLVSLLFAPGAETAYPSSQQDGYGRFRPFPCQSPIGTDGEDQLRRCLWSLQDALDRIVRLTLRKVQG